MQKNSVFQAASFGATVPIKNKLPKRGICCYFYYSYNYASLLLFASLAQANEALNRPDLSSFCCDTSSKRGQSSFFFQSISLLLSKIKTSIKKKTVL